MDFELWWLLPIPAIFFALGWIAARIDIKHLLRESRALPLSYFRGLNFLLNEQPDKAIESFIEVVKVDPQTIDLHFALGSLFRRQGEIERAIRMHQNLLDRVGPAGRQADDGHATSWRRTSTARACSTAPRSCSPSSTARRSSIRRCRTSSRSTRRRRTGPRRSPRCSGWRCSPSSRTSRRSRSTTASSRRPRCSSPTTRTVQAELDPAFATYRGCTRATLLPGDLEAQQGRPAEALATWQKIETQNPAFLALAADRFADAVSPAGRRARRASACCATTRRSTRRSTC